MKTLAITGPTSGIGKETVRALLPHFQRILLLARDEKKAQQLIGSFTLAEQEKLGFVACDLMRMDSVLAAADTLAQEIPHLDVLINNAGGIFDEKTITVDGFEQSLSVNHLGHMLLTLKLLPLLLRSQLKKVIQVASEAHKGASPRWDDLSYSKRNYKGFQAYANVKLYNILLAKSLVDQYGAQGLQAFSLHPGVVKTNFAAETKGIFKFFWKLAGPFMITAEQGAKTTVKLAKEKIPPAYNGAYFKKRARGLLFFPGE
ncbi:short-chain dehydrogenase/reductase SDR [Nitritalea halalkaliphila LW7]|uniref:Short-chain dehydrogenase/reductase SDR n=1 Tax=Nitritalea halalkaliphila LW7 TaxID=1189621 RepID=I5C7L8_9BACT|nr:SDR family NAD(P)-dependent oxidoreductase [Nitritalea halalkaliphila]EIM77820.1 short-chain dehydrogenase/reductase SDR [Nitritalea halalkaliphila LW7]